jgi:hypothetical protein
MTNKKLRSLIFRANKPNNKFPKVAISDTIDFTCIGINGEYVIFYLLKENDKYVGIAQIICYKKDLHVYIKVPYRRHGIAYNALHDHILPHQLHQRGTMFVTAISSAGKALMEKFNTPYTGHSDYALNKENFEEFSDTRWHEIIDEMTEKLGVESSNDWWY